ncbi:hypothetical protein CDAR_586481 [Caerostris darwini]|uniref:Uncharacterized protein n=1 Tax=Caerostris darwini TaxID=1538125 RepID=A0AAV4QB50_9ARAC|nr:hypothetical protein CDAR_586481 [Caerostris darwini]
MLIINYKIHLSCLSEEEEGKLLEELLEVGKLATSKKPVPFVSLLTPPSSQVIKIAMDRAYVRRSAREERTINRENFNLFVKSSVLLIMSL